MTKFSYVGRLITKIWSHGSKDEDNDSLEDNDPNMWYQDLKKHAYGEFSFAVVQANEELEDYSQVEIGQKDTFFGIYDGHGGPQASKYYCDNLFPNLINLSKDEGLIYPEILRHAISVTETEFLEDVGKKTPQMALVGSCCLAGHITRKSLFLSYMGDSRAIIGSVVSRGPFKFNKIVAEQITKLRSLSDEEVRRALKCYHQNDQLKVQEVEQIKGNLQVFRTLGHTYFMRYAVPELQLFHPIWNPIDRLHDDPELSVREFQPNDRFVVFASYGFWEHITDQQVVKIVHNNPRSGIARRLLKSVMTEAARKGNTRYEDLRNIEKGFRRSFHDDITVIVVFVDYKLLDPVNKGMITVEEAERVSIQGFSNSTHPSVFKKLRKRFSKQSTILD